MTTAKTSSLSYRIEPELKQVLYTAAQRGHRPLANMVAVLNMNYCGGSDIAVPEEGSFSDGAPRGLVETSAGNA